VKGELDSWNEAQEALNSAMDRYGITVDQLGGKFKQAGLDKIGIALLKDFEILKAAGVDVSLITEKMAEDVSDYVNRVVASGSTIPLAMKPMIEQMIEQGKLLDENGKAYESLEEAGISFAQTLEEGISSAVEAINKLVAVLAKGFNIPVSVLNTTPTNASAYGGPEDAFSAADGYGPKKLAQDTLFLAHKDEHVMIAPKGVRFKSAARGYYENEPEAGGGGNLPGGSQPGGGAAEETPVSAESVESIATQVAAALSSEISAVVEQVARPITIAPEIHINENPEGDKESRIERRRATVRDVTNAFRAREPELILEVRRAMSIA